MHNGGGVRVARDEGSLRSVVRNVPSLDADRRFGSDGAGMAEVLGPRRLPHYGSPAAGAAAGMMGSMIGRMHYVVVDCPDPLPSPGSIQRCWGCR